MENIATNIKEDYIINLLQEIKDKFKSSGLDFDNINFECQCIKKVYIKTDKTLGKKDILKISNKNEYNITEKKQYKSLKEIQKNLKLNFYDSITKIVELVPKLNIGDKYIPIKAFNLENDKEEFLENQNRVCVINIWNEKTKTSLTGLTKILNCIEKNKDKLIKKNVVFYALHQKQVYSNTKTFIAEKNLNKYPDLLKHFYNDYNKVDLDSIEIFNFIEGQKEIFIVVDKDGTIMHLGQFYEYSLEDKVKDILQKKKEIVVEEKIEPIKSSVISSNNENQNSYQNENLNIITKTDKDQKQEIINIYNDNKKLENNSNDNNELKDDLDDYNNKISDLKFYDNFQNQESVSEFSNVKFFVQKKIQKLKEESQHKENNINLLNNIKEDIINNLSSLKISINNQNSQTNLSDFSNFQKKSPGLIKIKTPINSNLDNLKALQDLSTSKNIINPNLEKTYNKNIFGKLVDYVSSALPISPIITNEKFDNFQAEFRKLYNVPKSPLEVNYLMFCELSKIFKYNINLKEFKLKQEENQPEFLIKFECFEKELKFLNLLLNKFFTKEEIEKYNFSINEIPSLSVDIQQTSSCNLCQVVINIEELQFYCVYCKISFCHRCVKEFNNKYTGFGALVHKEHNLLVFKNPNKQNLQNLAKFKFGKNLYTFFDEVELKRYHNFVCDICGNSKNHEERYICMNCRPGLLQNGGFTDICTKCFERIHVEDETSLISKMDHKPNHVYLHMIYSGIDYYDF